MILSDHCFPYLPCHAKWKSSQWAAPSNSESDPGANNQTGRIWRDQTAAGDGSHQHCESSISPPIQRVYSECLISWDGVVHEFMGWTNNFATMLWQVWFNQGWVSLCISKTDCYQTHSSALMNDYQMCSAQCYCHEPLLNWLFSEIVWMWHETPHHRSWENCGLHHGFFCWAQLYI